MIERQYEHNAHYQRPSVSVEERIVTDMSDPEHFQKYLGKEKYYRDFLIFWQNEIERKGWEIVLNEHVFADNEKADDLLARLYAGPNSLLSHEAFTDGRQASYTLSSISALALNSTNPPSSQKH